jgi:chromosome segregation ATPase
MDSPLKTELNTKILSLNNDITVLKSEITNLNIDINSLKDEKDLALTKYEDQGMRLNSFNSIILQINTKLNEITEIQKQITEKENQITEIQKQITKEKDAGKNYKMKFL